MSKLTVKFPFDFTPNGGTVHDLGYSYTKEIERIYDLLNDIRENDEGVNEPQPKQLMVSETGKIYIRSLDNMSWVYMGELKQNFGLQELDFVKKEDINFGLSDDGETPLLNVNISGSASKFGAVTVKADSLKDGDVFVYDSANNLFVNKNVPVIDPVTGMIDVSTTGNCGTIAGIPLLTTNIQDGEVIVYRPSLGGFVNETKASGVGAKELAFLVNDILLFQYSGVATRNLRVVATTAEEPTEDETASKALFWFKPV